jgi:NhaP-type Na+/H+ and K+/H+ antiporter
VLIGSLFCSLWLLAVTRFGLVAGMSMWFADRIFRAEIMVNPVGWHAGRMYLLLGAVGVLAVYAFVISVGNRPILSTKLLDQHS